jgi:hypothetical protein
VNADLDVQRRLQEELDSGEKIVWQGQPKTRFFSGPGIIFTLIGPVWIAVIGSGFFLHGSHLRRMDEMFPFLIVPLVLVLVGVIGPLAQYYSSFRTHYLLTNRRAMIITLGSTKKVLSYYPDKLQSLERTEKKNGWGNIVIEKAMNTGLTRNNAALREIGFMNIPNVKTVEGMMRALATKTSSSRDS